jgi:tyrosine-protein phosphatase SIW14
LLPQRSYMKEHKFSPVTKKIAPKRQSLFFMSTVVAFVVLTSAVAGFADSDRKNRKSVTEPVTLETCDVENFGKVNDHYYRGAQPEEGQYEQLRALGVKTIIDLRDDAKDYAKAKAESAGLRYINLPMSDKKYPEEESVNKFLQYANDSNNWPIYVHCAGGRHRTGAMTAIYRMTVDGWQIEKAYDEMKDYDFYTRWGHKAMKTFVFDYAKELLARRVRSTTAESNVIAPSRDN